jgi:hypothetical protein
MAMAANESEVSKEFAAIEIFGLYILTRRVIVEDAYDRRSGAMRDEARWVGYT